MLPPTEPSLKAAMTGLMGGERSGRWLTSQSKPGQNLRAFTALRFGSKKIEHSKRFTTFIANIETNSWGIGSRRGNLVNWPRGIARCRPPCSAEDFLICLCLFVTSSGYRLKEIGSSEFTLSSSSCMVQTLNPTTLEPHN